MAESAQSFEESTPDEQIGRNVAAFRGSRSQKDVAAAMREHGWKWSQATVWAIEKGERPLKLAEAHDLVAVLDARNVSRLLAGDAGTQVSAATFACHARAADVSEAVTRFREAQLNLVVALGELESSNEPFSFGAVASAESWLDRRAIDRLVRAGTRKFWGESDDADDTEVEESPAVFEPDPNIDLTEHRPDGAETASQLTALAERIRTWHASR